MKIAFDSAKDIVNAEKHGVSLSEAQQLDWDLLLCAPDTRRDYAELRETGFAPIGKRVYNVVFVQRGMVYRIISLRKANRREVIAYDQALQAHGIHPAEP